MSPKSWFCRAVSAAVCACVLYAIPATGQTVTPPSQEATPQALRDELERLRSEFETVRDAYGARLAAIEAKLVTMEAAQATPAAAQPTAAPTPPTEAAVPPGAAGAGGATGQLPVYGGAAAASKIFNPDIAVIGNFLGTAGENDVDPAPAFEMNEVEATFQAVVDPYARGDFFLSFSSEGVELEEGYLTFSALPGGLLAKVGKFKQQFGKTNTLHPHQLPWIDQPIAHQNLLGGEEGLNDAGVSISGLIMNPWIFLEATGEVYRGSSGVFESHERSHLSWLGRLRAYRDITESTNLDVGGSFAWGHNEEGPEFTTRLVGVDATLRYRPLRRAIYRRFMGRSELFWSRREQTDGPASAFGMYASADYQFSRRWFAGLRYDWSERVFDPSLVDKGPSVLLTFWPSEFSQIRGQYRRLRYAEGTTANELLFQFLFSIGAHGAHAF